MFLRMWFALLRATDERLIWASQIAVLQRQLDTVQRRVRAGDAPRAELPSAEAALAQAEQGASQANARIEMARAELAANFPDLPLINLPAIATPALPEDSEGKWRERVLEHNHEIQLAAFRRVQAELLAQRARADRMPDPTIGLRYLSERSGAEHVLGLTFSIPIPGALRDNGVQLALAQLDLRSEQESAVIRRVGGEAIGVFRSARDAFEIWQKAAFAAQRLGQHADLAARAYSLGEGALNEVLLARRAANESRLLALSAQSESQEARYRLILDAHRLWPFDDDDAVAESRTGVVRSN